MNKVQEIFRLASLYRDQDKGQPWEDLFDFICRIGPENVFAYKKDLIFYFVKYMGSYGMFRGKRLFTPTKLSNVLLEGQSVYLKYLIQPTKYHIEAWKKTYELVTRRNINGSAVVISKVLMGFGGRTPAFDRRFLNVMRSNPGLLELGVNGLVSLLKESGRHPFKTQAGNAIPWERTLDMAFWMAGSEDYEGWLS